MTVPGGRRDTYLFAPAEPSARSGRSQAVLIRCWNVVPMPGLPTWISFHNILFIVCLLLFFFPKLTR